MKYTIRKTLENYTIKTYLSDSKPPEDAIDCSLGINPFGFTPTITKEIYADTYDGISNYPGYPYPQLKKAICAYLAPEATIEPEQVYLNNGSMAMLINLNRLLLNPGDKVLCVAPTFTSTVSDMVAMGAEIESIPLEENQQFQISMDAIVHALNPSHAIIYLDNPNNPTGQVIPLSELERLAKIAEENNTLLIVDEAYGDFMERSNSAAVLTQDHSNVIVVKTLSKGLGLAGLRTGYAVVPKAFVPYMDKLPAEMALTETAARLAPYALKDKGFLEMSKNKVAENKDRLLKSLKVLKASKTDNTVPIVLLYTEKDIHLYELLLKHGIIAENGEDFNGIGKRHVRLRVPATIDDLLKRMESVEGALSANG